MKKIGCILIIAMLLTACQSSKKTLTTTATTTATEVEIKKPVEKITKDTVNVDRPAEAFSEVIKKEKEINNEVVEKAPVLEVFNHSGWDQLLNKYVTADGRVNYEGFRNDKGILRDYIASLGANMPSESWSREDKLAYWMNAYNAMTVDLIVRNLPLESIKDIDKPWDQRLWKLGDKWYNLDEIEHQIIRKMGEPRIHFALVCAAKSCPKLYNKAFTPDELSDDLTRLTEEFLADKSKNIITENNLKLSKIFKWFAKDFKQNGSLIDFLNEYSNVNISNKAKKSFKDYNWDLND